MKTWINKITETNHKGTYKLERVTISKESLKISGTAISRISNLGTQTQGYRDTYIKDQGVTVRHISGSLRE